MALVVPGRPGTAPVGPEARQTHGVVLAACVAAVLARLLYLDQPLRPDEGGYLYVARRWAEGGAFLYGDHHVDRPPLLMLLFRLAALSDWDGAIRLLVLPGVVVAVVALAAAGALLAGPVGARWAAVAAAALLCTPAVGADQAGGALFAASFVSVGLASGLAAWRATVPRQRFLLAVVAGACGAAAGLVKQNFLEALVFLAALVVAQSLLVRRLTDRTLAVAGGGLVGALLPAVLLLGWARSSGIGPGRLWAELVVFRGEALAVIWGGHVGAPVQRAALLVLLAVVTGLAPLVLAWVRRGVAARRTPESWAVTACLVWAGCSMVAGGSYWPHYLLELVPPVVLAIALVVGTATPAAARMRRWAVVSVASAVAATAVVTVVFATQPGASHQQLTGRWLGSAARPGDTAVVLYGNPSILESADLDTPYPHLWSLSMRTLDPDQDLLVRTLAGRRAPEWVVLMGWPNAWDIDADGELRSTIWGRYAHVATVCEHRVLLRRDLGRPTDGRLPAVPDCR